MQNISIHQHQDETDSLLNSPTAAAANLLAQKLNQKEKDNHSPSSGSNLVAQAAAHVASRFRKLRDLNFGRTQVTSTTDLVPLADSIGVPRATATTYSIAIPPVNPNYYTPTVLNPIISTNLQHSNNSQNHNHHQNPQSYQARGYHPNGFV